MPAPTWLRPIRAFREARDRSVGETDPWVGARTYYYRMRYHRVAVFGAGVKVRSRLRLRGPGRIHIGDGCLFDGRSRLNSIRAAGQGATVDIGADCVLNGLDITAAADVTIASEVHVVGELTFDGPGHLSIGRGCMIGSRNAIHTLRSAATVRIGEECFINGVDIVATEGVEFGRRCIVGESSLVTTDYHSARPDRWSPEASVRSGPITVGENVWIAAKVIVTKGVSIGDNSVVSIGTVVREDVPMNVIVASHEQRVVKKLGDDPVLPPTTWPTWWSRGAD